MRVQRTFRLTNVQYTTEKEPEFLTMLPVRWKSTLRQVRACVFCEHSTLGTHTFHICLIDRIIES